jgi:hypothetical protein
MLSAPSKWIISNPISDANAVIKKLQDFLPESAVPLLTEHEIEGLLDITSKDNQIAIVVLSDKASPPSLLRNVALSVKKLAHVVFITNPSETYLKTIGNPALPAILAMSPQTPEDRSRYSVRNTSNLCIYL